MKELLKNIKYHFELQRKEKKKLQVPEVHGVYKRLWQDAGSKEERMDSLKQHIEDIMKSSLMKKLWLEKQHNN